MNNEMKLSVKITLKIISILSIFIFLSCSPKQNIVTNKTDKIVEIDTTVNEIGRLLPKKLRDISFGITSAHSPNPCYAEFENGKYVWKHNTTVVVNEDLEIVEYGGFLWTKKGWYLRVVYTPKDFDEHYGTINGQLKKGVVYTDPSSWRMGDKLSAGDAMWFYIAKDKNGNLYKGIAPIETEGKMLQDMGIKKGFTKFSVSKSKINWTGYGEVGNYSLTGDIGLKTGIFVLKNDSLKNVELVFDMQTINHQEKQLKEHLMGEDFFDVKKFPISQFILSKPVYLKANKLIAEGTLTVKGISQEISIPLMYSLANNEFQGKISVDRTKFGMRYGSKSFFDNLGDQAIKNTFDLGFVLKVE
jgi:polyisoprenoid-binding protein YceI